MRKSRLVGLAAAIAISPAPVVAAGAEPAEPPALTYDAQTRGPVPIPPGERGLQTVTAQPWFKVSERALLLEGPSFERNGDLVFTDAGSGRIFRLTPDKRLSSLIAPNKLGLDGLAVHKDGRIFAAGIGDFAHGSIVAVRPDGSNLRTIVPVEAGYVPNDIVFDAHGGFYFSDFRGTSTDPTGGVYYVAPDMKTITAVLPHLAMANGVALSPDGKVLWVTEFARNLLHRVELANATTPAPIGTAIPYRFIGPAPDSMRVDADGNVYVAIYGQGRVLAFNRNGIPIGQVLLPGRDAGHNLFSTNMALRPGSNDLFIVANDGNGGQGASIFHAKAFAKAPTLYSHQ